MAASVALSSGINYSAKWQKDLIQHAHVKHTAVGAKLARNER